MKKSLLDHLRREIVQRNLLVRNKVKQAARNVLCGLDFVEVDTPILGPMLPEYSENQFVAQLGYEKIWCLPQAPQLYSQALVISGLSRYFQFPHCFRPEDHDPGRTDQAFEFLQIDIEMLTSSDADIRSVAERIIVRICEDLGLGGANVPFPEIDAIECMREYDTDKPDLRTSADDLSFLWVKDFPLVEYGWNPTRGKMSPSHHVFALPHRDIREISDLDELLTMKTHSFDLVLNGMEIGGGDLRINDHDLQVAVLDFFGVSHKDFEVFLSILEKGAPLHGGMALGFERLMMQLTRCTDIADVVAFPQWSIR